MEWIYTAEMDRDVDASAGPVTTIDVEYEAVTDTFWTGLTHYRTPKDYAFVPHMAHLTLDDAKIRADSWAREIAADARMMAR